MLGLGTEILLAAGGNIMGIVSGLLANAQKAKADQHKMMMEQLTFNLERMKIQSELSNKEFETRTKDKFSSFTRRLLVLSFLAMVILISVAPMLTGINIAVPTEMKSGGKYLLGLIDTTKTWTEWTIIEGAAMFRSTYDQVLIMIFSFYVGSSAVKR